MKFSTPKRITLFLIFAFLGLAGACAKQSASIGPNTDESGSALRGYDAVAYFAANNAVKGDPKFEYIWNGAKWYFSSEENMMKFRENPNAYAPQFGGYCSYAVSEGYTADGDPEAWKIVDGKLYLNYDKKVREKWEQDQQQRIDKGKSNWESFKTKAPEHKK